MVGRSNVGKSSLINAVLGRKAVARVSQTPGKTQAVQFYLVNEQFYIVDLPGYGYAKVPRDMRRSWGDLMATFFESSEALRVLFLLLDYRRIPSDEDLEMFEWTKAAGVDYRFVLTKADKLSNNQRAQGKRAIQKALEVDADTFIDFSKLTREGVDVIWRVIDGHLKAAKNNAVRDAR